MKSTYRSIHLAVTVFLTFLLVLAIVWSGLAIWYDGLKESWFAAVAAGSFVVLCLAVLCNVRPYSAAMRITFIPVLLIIFWWLGIVPSNDRDWLPEVSRPPRAELDGNILTVHNVRNFEYRSEVDFTEKWETRTYDLDKLVGVDLFLSYWGPRVIAHTISSWEFSDGSHLAISIETRKEKGESYSAVRGFFRQFELFYVVADERDVIGLRTNHKGEQVYLYRIRMPLEDAREILIHFLKEANRLDLNARWYNALIHNCTTVMEQHVRAIGRHRPWEWQIIANGYLDELAYIEGTIANALPFEEMRARSNITEKAKTGGLGEGFSERIRQGLPGERAGR